MNHLSERGIKVLASLGLILTTMIWGFAFVVMKNSVDVIPPTYLLAVRFSMSYFNTEEEMDLAAMAVRELAS